jgi:hypothetical protein
VRNRFTAKKKKKILERESSKTKLQASLSSENLDLFILDLVVFLEFFVHLEL